MNISNTRSLLVTGAVLATLLPGYSSPWSPLSGEPLATSALATALWLFSLVSVVSLWRGHRAAVLNALIFTTVCQNTLVGFFIKDYTSADAIWLALGYKTFFLIIVFVLFGFSSLSAFRGRLNILPHELVLLGFVGAIAALSLQASFGFAELGNLRNFASLALLYLVGRWGVTSWRDLVLVSNFLLVVAFALCAFGIFERFFIGLDEWVGWFHIDRITEAKFQLVYVDPSDLEIAAPSWFTGYLGIYSGRRLASLVADPVNLSALLAGLTFLTIKLRRSALTALLATCLLLTFGKAAHAGLATALWVDYRLKRVSIGRALVEISPLVFVFAAIMLAGDVYGSVHIRGLLAGIESLFSAPLGHGLGAGGNLAQIVGSVDTAGWIESGGESGIGVAIHQFGVIGLALPAFVILYVRRIQLVRARVPVEYLPYVYAAVGMLVINLVGTIFQEASLGPQSTVIAYLYAGAVFGALARSGQLNDLQTDNSAWDPVRVG